jgi:hypothetical protein
VNVDIFGLAFGLLDFVSKLIERAAQSGELTTAQKAVLQEKAEALFAKYSTAPPPPAGLK